PLVFSGFWSKDAILHSAHGWPVSQMPFLLGVIGAFLTAFYMTRQVALVFFGKARSEDSEHAHESPRVMTVPLMILAVCAIVLGFIGTPFWPWFQSFLRQHHEESSGVVSLMILSSVIVFAGLGLGWWLYGRKPMQKADEPDPLEKLPVKMHTWFATKYKIDEL